MTRLIAAILLPVIFLSGCAGYSPFEEKPAQISVKLVAYNQTLPKSFFDQSMAVIRMQHPNAKFFSASPATAYGDLSYAYIEYVPNQGSKEVFLHALITDYSYAWRADERFSLKERLKYRTKFNSILENIQKSRTPEFRRGR